jgi:hypothetical protein
MKREEFTQSRFILTEGFEDCAFATAFVLFRNPRFPPMDIDSVDNVGESRGKEGFEDAIVAASDKRGFPAIDDVVLLTDNDEKPQDSFENVRAQIEQANKQLERKWAVPDRPGERADGNPSVSIWMWPESGTPGCMETLLWRVICAKYAALSDCIERASVCMEATKANKWPIQKIDKAKVRAFLALYNKRSPLVRFDVLWREHPTIFPIDRKEFNAFATFLRR